MSCIVVQTTLSDLFELLCHECGRRRLGDCVLCQGGRGALLERREYITVRLDKGAPPLDGPPMGAALN